MFKPNDKVMAIMNAYPVNRITRVEPISAIIKTNSIITVRRIVSEKYNNTFLFTTVIDSREYMYYGSAFKLHINYSKIWRDINNSSQDA